MATKKFNHTKVFSYPDVWNQPILLSMEALSYQGNISTRDKKGNLVLRSNALSQLCYSRVLNEPEIESYGWSKDRLMSLRNNAGRHNTAGLYWQQQLYDKVGKDLYNRAYASFRGRLYSGSAALGVTLGTYKESREMMVDRFNSLNQRADEAAARIATAKNKTKAVASLHLEVVFGWAPLLSDIHAVTTTVIGKDPLLDIQTVKGQASGILSDVRIAVGNGTTLSHTGRYKVEVGSRVRVANMNLWLAERAGLLNPASVVWDLVPWSFVVNMFMNTGQLVNSLTDFVGLSFENQYVQHKCAGVNTYTSYGGNSTIVKYERCKVRQIGSIPRPTFMFKLPNANMELAAIAGSLFTQKAAALGRLIKPIVKNW